MYKKHRSKWGQMSRGMPQGCISGIGSIAKIMSPLVFTPLTGANQNGIWSKFDPREGRFLMQLVKALLSINWGVSSRPKLQSSRDYASNNSQNSRYIGPSGIIISSLSQIHCNPFSGMSRYFCSLTRSTVTSENCSISQSGGSQHRFKNWQENRKHKLTASTFSGAIGFWPHRRVQLWQEKVGLIAPFNEEIITGWSNIKEAVALEKYKLITGNSVYFSDFRIYNEGNNEDDWLAASPDGLLDHAVHGLSFGGVLEIKCPFFKGEMYRALPWSRLPFHCMPQAQGLMEILNRDWMDLYCWTPNGSSLFRIFRDKEYWNLVRSALSDFWWKHVQPAKVLCLKDPSRDLFEVVKPFKPSDRHELWPDILRASKRLVDESHLLVREVHGDLRPFAENIHRPPYGWNNSGFLSHLVHLLREDGASDKPIDSAVLSRMKQFREMNKLKKLALKADVDKSGTIDYVEFITTTMHRH
ncbi:hypothetical protein H6P81_018722 [Aristolochia fimbriata]|uniref:EF-hand domain-containing protein n=1 Tax=Aristolochia fimbriata TaxID=158543 RepID=A0AAV7E246_ARIFI|nr:hypothetical protein H6P81_018722 [Aristolochia fimbriata]